jgi:transposase
MGRWHLKQNPKKQNGKVYKYYNIAENYSDSHGKHQKHNIKHLGTLSDEKANQVKLALRAMNGEDLLLVNFDDLRFIDSKKYLDVALFSHIYDSLGLNDAFDVKSDKVVGTKEVAKILTLSRCLDPQAHYKTVDWFQDSYLPQIMNIQDGKYNKDKIFDELSNIHKQAEFLQKRLLKLSQDYNKGELSLYFFDGTTSYFEGTECELAESGKDKTSGYQDKIILILLVTDRKGFPITWEVFHGRASEKVEIQKLLQKLSDKFGITEVTFCFDRGFATENNFNWIADHLRLNSKYISGLDRDQIDSAFKINEFSEFTRDKLIKELEKIHALKERSGHERVIPIDGFYNLGKDRFYKDLGVKNGKRHVVSFNINIYEKEKQDRLNNIVQTENEIIFMNKDLEVARGDRDEDILKKKLDKILSKRRLTKIVEYKIIPKAVSSKKDKVQSFTIEATINKAQLKDIEKYDGVLVYVTNHTEKDDLVYKMPASLIVENYKNKYAIENAFRHLKSFADLRPFYVYRTEHVKAHVDICMTSYFINHYIYQKLISSDLSLHQFHEIIKSNSRTCKLEVGIGGQTKTILKVLSKEVLTAIKLLGAEDVISKKTLGALSIKAS